MLPAAAGSDAAAPGSDAAAVAAAPVGADSESEPEESEESEELDEDEAESVEKPRPITAPFSGVSRGLGQMVAPAEGGVGGMNELRSFSGGRSPGGSLTLALVNANSSA